MRILSIKLVFKATRLDEITMSANREENKELTPEIPQYQEIRKKKTTQKRRLRMNNKECRRKTKIMCMLKAK